MPRLRLRCKKRAYDCGSKNPSVKKGLGLNPRSGAGGQLRLWLPRGQVPLQFLFPATSPLRARGRLSPPPVAEAGASVTRAQSVRGMAALGNLRVKLPAGLRPLRPAVKRTAAHLQPPPPAAAAALYVHVSPAEETCRKLL